MSRALTWSDEKRRLFRFETNLVVSAGAGSGKTTALAELYLRLLEGRPPSEDGPGGLGPDGRPLEPEEMAVVTFTDKAARDLRRKLREGLLERLDVAASSADSPGRRVALERWARAREAFETAPVGTIHSYAARLLREHPIEAGVDPGFDVLDEPDAQTLRQESVARVLRAALDRRDPGVAALLRHVQLPDIGDHGAGLESSLVSALARLRGAGTSVEMLRRATGASLAALDGPRRQVAADIEAAASAVADIPAAGPFLERWRALPEAARRLDPALGDASWAALLALPPLAKSWKGPGSTGAARRALAAALEETALLGWQRLATPLGDAFLDLLSRAEAEYGLARRRRHALDFDDLEEHAVRLLRRDQEAGGAPLASRPAAVLVDEFQDNNRRQFDLVTLLAGDGRGGLRPRSLVVVGDPKQSIYRFRGADVSVFDRMKRLVLGDAEPIRFTDNYRSTRRILTFVNGVFERYMRPAAAGRPAYEVPFDEADRLEPRPDAAEGAPVEVLCLPPNERADVRALREAEAVARRVGQLVTGGVRPGDVAILMRTVRNAGVLQRRLEAAGIPAYLASGGGFYGAPEVRDVLCLLSSLDCPFDDVSLAAVVRSPFAGISDDALLLLARPVPGRHARPLHRAFAGGSLAAPVPPLAEADRARLDMFAGWHRELRQRKDRTPPPDLIEEALERSGYLAVCLTRAGGDQQAGNLRKLVEQARAFEGRAGRTLRDFVQELRRLVEAEPRETAAQVVGEGEDVVRIMTIHAAKGLEFPVVVLPGCASTPVVESGAVRLDESPDGPGLAVRPVDPTSLESQGTWLAERVRAVAGAKDAAEWRRLFYVASTRAMERLVILGEHPVTSTGRPADFDTWRRQVDALLEAEPQLERDGVVRRIPWGELPEAVGSGLASLEAAVPAEVAPAEAASAEAALAETASANGAALERVLASVQWRPAPPRRFAYTVTELAEFAVCPRRYQLTRRLGLSDGGEPWFDGLDEPDVEADAESDGIEIDAPGLDPRDRGDLVHAVLEQVPLDLDGPALEKRVRELVSRFSGADPDRIGDVDRAALVSSIVGFLGSPTGQAVVAAWRESPDRVLREYPFVVRLADDGRSAVIRGAIDALWSEDGKAWNVLDYKTTRHPEQALERYEAQLLAYELAATCLTGAPSSRTGLVIVGHAATGALHVSNGDTGPARRALDLGSLVGRITRLDQQTTHDERWPGISRDLCTGLRCGFIGRCHGY